MPTMIDTYSWLTVTPPSARGLRAERRGQRVDLRAPRDRREAPEHGAEPDREHDHRELRLPDDAPEDGASSAAPNSATMAMASAKRDPVAEAVPDDEHVAREGAEHQEVALGEVHQLGGLVDEDEAEGDQAVDAADGEAVQDELQDGVQAILPNVADGAPPSGLYGRLRAASHAYTGRRPWRQIAPWSSPTAAAGLRQTVLTAASGQR